MIRLLKLFWTGDWHLHRWKTEEVVPLMSPRAEHPIGKRAYCRCEQCGKWRLFDMS